MIEIINAFLIGWAASMTANHTDFIQRFRTYLKNKDNLVNHDLQKGVKRSFLESLQHTARECRAELTSQNEGRFSFKRVFTRSAPTHRDSIAWLDRKHNELAKELERLRKEEFTEIPFNSSDEIAALMKPSGIKADEVIRSVRQKLLHNALRDDDGAPECYKEAVRAKLFERMCERFASEIKHTPEVRHIFDSQLLVQISANQADAMQMQGDTLQRIQNVEELLFRLCSAFGLQPISDIRWMMRVNADVRDIDMNSLQSGIEQMKQLSDDHSLKITGIEGSRSIMLIIEGSRRGFERIRSLFESRKLTEMLGIPVEELRMESDGLAVKEITVPISPVHHPVGQKRLSGERRRLERELERHEKSEQRLTDKIEYLEKALSGKAEDAHKYQLEMEVRNVHDELEKVRTKIDQVYEKMEDLERG
jgi:hypothetical protein